jgi:hypothetical protein
MLIQTRIQNYYRSLLSLLDEQVKQLSKDAQQIAYNIVLVQEKISCLKETINTLTKRKTCKRRYVRAEETLIVSKVSELIAAKEGSSCEECKTPAKRVRAERRCGRCSEIGHNSRTCKVEIEDVDNSNASVLRYIAA